MMAVAMHTAKHARSFSIRPWHFSRGVISFSWLLTAAFFSDRVRDSEKEHSARVRARRIAARAARECSSRCI